MTLRNEFLLGQNAVEVRATLAPHRTRLDYLLLQMLLAQESQTPMATDIRANVAARVGRLPPTHPTLLVSMVFLRDRAVRPQKKQYLRYLIEIARDTVKKPRRPQPRKIFLLRPQAE
jgi:hypothetical protein